MQEFLLHAAKEHVRIAQPFLTTPYIEDKFEYSNNTKSIEPSLARF